MTTTYVTITSPAPDGTLEVETSAHSSVVEALDYVLRHSTVQTGPTHITIVTPE